MEIKKAAPCSYGADIREDSHEQDHHAECRGLDKQILKHFIKNHVQL